MPCIEITDEMVEWATAGVVNAQDAEMKAFLRGEIEANTWRPEVYARAALAAVFGQEDRDG
jgi:hypothetical protein